jgi:hypothetical protein
MRAVDGWVRAAFFRRFLDFRLFPFRQRVSARPPATNASRWAATGVELVKKLLLKTKTCKGLKVFVDIID